LSFFSIVNVDFLQIEHLHYFVDDTGGVVRLKKLVGPDAAKDALTLIVLS
jgi:hypothetical protein